MKSVLVGKEVVSRANMVAMRFFYDACIPTNVVNSFYFKSMLDVISAIGPGYKGPNYHQLWVNLLKDANKEVRHVKDATNLFQLFDEVIEWVCPLNVVHVVTNNAVNYVAIGRLISQKHKHINWSPYVAHRLNLVFKDVEKGNDGRRFSDLAFFVDSKYSRDNKSRVAVSIILDNRFGNDCLIVVNLMSPLMRLLHIVDCDERPSMGYVYEDMYKENFCNKLTIIGSVMDVIDQKVLKDKLDMMNEMKLFCDRLGSLI
ncbi:hypothetical protein CK203_102068 [Vitis vinifera]|uniref:DUF659 domain-containing protein n=1 Tax=Vitis vinifera TaxID=29760 RepID=A0A438EJI8_VITVI|nr:hypothetical protein CK203_102068 [Vitis vinifera]